MKQDRKPTPAEIRRVFSEMGRRKSQAKAAASRENGKKGGRPKATGARLYWVVHTVAPFGYRGPHTFKEPAAALAYLRERFPGRGIQFDSGKFDVNGCGIIAEGDDGYIDAGEIFGMFK